MVDDNPRPRRPAPRSASETPRPARRRRSVREPEWEGLPIVGGNVRQHRRAQSLSLKMLAKASGVSRSMLSQIECGQSVPTILVLWKIARALGVDMSELVKGVRGEEPNQGD
jgi:ribosome-binding protein aMBF1 (putative translation factor)